VRQYRDGLAATLDRMAGTPSRERSATSPDRPTEAFARGVDWIIAAALANQGVLNGYLSAVQDDMLTGYASATAPRRDVTQQDATILALREIAEVDRDVLTWYEGRFGAQRQASITDGVRRTLTAPMPRLEVPSRSDPALGLWSESARLFRASPEASQAWSCLLRAPSLHSADDDAMRRAMVVAATARVRGVVARWGEFSERNRSSDWHFRRLGGAPWDPATVETVERELRDALLWRAARVDDGRPGVDLVERAERTAAWSNCARGR
jgi:hypothetical protein